MEGVENFVVELSEMVGVEISGYYLANKGTDDISNVHVGKYKNNKYDRAYKSYNPYRNYPSKIGGLYEHTDWHTHPSRAADSDRTQASRRDKESKANTQEFQKQVKKIIILTKGYLPIEY